MGIDFDEMLTQLKAEIAGLASNEFKDFAVEAASDGTSLLHTMEGKLKKYAQQLEDGKITEDDFKLLFLGNKDLVQMSALTKAGLQAARIDAFKSAVFNTIINTVVNFV